MTPHDRIAPGFASSGAAACFWCLCSRHSSSVWHFSAALFVATIALMSVTRAQTPGISGVNVVINRIGSEEGLSNSSVWAFTQDRHGFVWIGTADGLNRFDGKRCIVYHASPDSTGLSNDWVWCLYCDQDGSLWIGTQVGLNRFDPLTQSFKKYFHDPTDPASLSSNEVRSILRDRAGVLWVGTAHGLNRLEKDGTTWTSFLPTLNDPAKEGGNFIDAILEDKQGRFWVATGMVFQGGGGLFQFDRGARTFLRVVYDSSDVSVLPYEWITSLYEDSFGNLWVSSNYRGLYKIDGVSGTRSPLTLPYSESNLPYSQVKGVRIDGRGIVWIATWGPGLFRFDSETNTFTRYFSNPSDLRSLSSSRINTIFLDRGGLLWIGTEEGGANTISAKPFLIRPMPRDSLGIAAGPENILVDKKGNLWIAAPAFGVWQFERASRRSIHRLRYSVNSLYQDRDGGIWFSALTRIVKCEPQTDTYKTVWKVPAYGEWTWALCVDSERNLWVGTNRALYRIERTMKRYTRLAHDALEPHSVTDGRILAIVEDISGSIWVGTAGGVNRYDKRTESFTRFTAGGRDSSNSSDTWCSGIYEDRSGKLWITTGTGLYQFNQTSSTFVKFLDREVGQIIEDEIGRFWLSSRGKLSVFNPADSTYREFGPSDGLEGAWVRSVGNRAKLQSGEFVFGTSNGILVFDPNSVRTLAYVPSIVITGVRMFNRPGPLRFSPGLLREITLAHEENVFTLEYAALSYDMPQYNQYAYRLEGFDKKWIYCGNRQEATYTNLDPGTYTFHVKGSNHDGVWNEAGTSLVVVVRPAYWQTWWFRGLLLLALIGSVATVVGYIERTKASRRIEQLERERAVERERARISQDMHDEVGASLSEISILSELVKRDLPRREQAAARAQEISDRSGEVIENIGEIIWALNPKNDPVESLIAYLRRYAGRYLELACIRCTFVAPVEVPAYHLTSAVRRNVFLVVKEALHNVVKHAAATEVRVDVETHEKTLVIRLQDNGKGFVPEDAGDTGNGLSSMRKRAADIDATIDIQSQPGCGTTVVLTVRV
jgi:ligand-binding sensor domain-containing protein/signal transduction histidine kinase